MVGKEVISYCTSCRMDLGHVIEAMQGDRIVKVNCKTCKKSHQFRNPKGIDTPAPKKAPKAKVAKEVRTVQEEWLRLKGLYSKSAPKSYNTKASFKVGDMVDHPSFGAGFVQTVLHPNKIEVVFERELKMLIHAGLQA